MKQSLIFLIKMYQATPLQAHSYCRHIPTCSHYMVDALNEYGLGKGLKLGIKRICNCRPGGTYGYDPIPKKEGN